MYYITQYSSGTQVVRTDTHEKRGKLFYFLQNNLPGIKHTRYIILGPAENSN